MKIVFDGIELNTASRELRRDGAVVPIEPKVFRLLEYIIDHRDRVVSKDELIETIWEGRFVSDSAVSSAVKAARKLVGDNGRDQHTIKTAFGTGFRFVKDIEIEAANQPDVAVASRATSRGATNLKRALLPLVGRDAESDRIGKLIAGKSLVSIVGPGGVGKTALAQDVGRQALGDSPGGVWFCELAAAEGSQIESVVMGALDRSAGAGPVNADQIVERLGHAPSLLILDNCEHVIDAVAELASDLVASLPTLTVLATSREALDVPGEHVLRIEGLDYSTEESSAVGLFWQRASEVARVPNTPENARIMRLISERLEGLPLAIELAVPRLVSNTPAELLEALDDQLAVLASRRRATLARHSTMDDAIAWSYELLDQDERDVLSNLSTFAGSFTQDAAVAICDTATAAEALHRLVRQSMVVFIPSETFSRFKLLEPIRQFAARQLSAEATAFARDRHASWFAARVQNLADDMRGPGEVDATDALTAEWADFGRALARGRETKSAKIAIDPLLALHIHLLWQLRIEGFAWLDAGIKACGLSDDRKAAADLVCAMGRWSAGDLEGSEALLAHSVEAGGETVATMYFRFYQAFAREDFEGVFQAGEAAAELAEDQGDPAWKTTTAAFRIIGRTMANPGDPVIPDLFDGLENRLKAHPWPTGDCCALLARVTFGFISGDAAEGQAYRAELDRVADDCSAPWFKITASGVGGQSQGEGDDPLSKIRRSAQNLRVAIASGDVMQLPTLIRFAAMELSDIGDAEAAAKIIGLVPKIRGLGEKGSMAPGYDEAVKLVRESMPADTFKRLVQKGAQLSLEGAADVLDAALAKASSS